MGGGDMQLVSMPWQNHLLADLPVAAQERIFPQLELVHLVSGTCLYKSDEAISHVFFPVDSVVSMLYTTDDGHESETAVIGNEGMVGIALFMGGKFTNNRTVVQSSGSAWRMPGYIFMRELNKHHELEPLLLRYTQYLITQMSQTAVCNRFHSINQQLCRRLLLSLDRVIQNRLLLTHELLASSLGVRREGVTEAARKLQRQGIIEYHRGIITILDRLNLEKLSCECYLVVRNEEERLLPHKCHHAPFQAGISAKTDFTNNISTNTNTRHKSYGGASSN